VQKKSGLEDLLSQENVKHADDETNCTFLEKMRKSWNSRSNKIQLIQNPTSFEETPDQKHLT
jgi:hypothetical protein